MPRRPAARVDGHARREPRARDDLVAEAGDEREALRLPVVALAGHLDVQVPARGIDVLGRVVEPTSATCGSDRSARPSRVTAAVTAGASAPPPRPVSTTLVGATAPAPTAAVSTSYPRTAGVSRDALVRAGPELEREERQGEQDQEAGGRARDELRVAHDEAREDRPEAVLRVGAVLEPAARQDANAVETLAGQRQRDREEGDGGEHRHGGDEQAADPEAAMNGSGMKTSIASPIATAVPLKTTARPAVAIVLTIASSRGSPARSSSRKR